MMQQQQQQQQQQPNAAQPEDGDGELEPDVEGNAMLEGVILPAFEHVSLFFSFLWTWLTG
jgi:hypothetical protein